MSAPVPVDAWAQWDNFPSHQESSAKLTSQVNCLPKSCLTGICLAKLTLQVFILPKSLNHSFVKTHMSQIFVCKDHLLVKLVSLCSNSSCFPCQKLVSQVSCFWLNFLLAHNSDQRLMPASLLRAKTTVGTSRKHLKIIWLLPREIIFNTEKI